MNKFKRNTCVIVIVFLMLIINIYNNYFFENKSYSKLVYGVMMITYSLNYILGCVWLNISGIKGLSFKDYKWSRFIIICFIPIILLILNVSIIIVTKKINLTIEIYQLFNIVIYSLFAANKVMILYYIIINNRKYMFKFSDILAVVVYCFAYVYLAYITPSTNADTPQEMFVMMLTESPRIHLESMLRGTYDCVLLVYLLLSYQVRLKYANKQLVQHE